MPFKFDLHSHSFFSSDGVSRPEEMIDVAKAKGLHGLAITDHNNCDSIDYLLEKGLVREDGLPVDGFLLVPGVEVTTAEGHLLCLGVRLPDDLKGTPAEEVCRLTHEAGGIVIAPHPYDLFRAGIRESVLDTLPLDAVEVFNAATTLHRHNQKARQYASRKALGMIAASDAHHASMIGTAHTLVDVEELTLSAVLAQIPKCRVTVERYQGFYACVKKALANIQRLTKRRPPKA